MKKLYLTGCILICCAAHSQTENPPQIKTDANKYVGVKVQQPDASQLMYTTNPKLLKTKSQTPKPAVALPIIPTPESAKKKTGPILSAVPITTK